MTESRAPRRGVAPFEQRRTRRGWGTLAAALSACVVCGCGGAETEARLPIAQERPEDEVLRVAKSWVSSLEDSGFRTPPSPITMFSETTTSTLTFTPGSTEAVEALSIDGSFKVRDATYQCQSRVKVKVTVAFGRHADEAAVEVRRPPVEIVRTCNAPGFPEPVLEVPASAARFALRGDQLVPFAPPTEKRAYLPAQ